MNIKQIKLIALFLFSLIIFGCAPMPIYNVMEAPVLAASNKTVTMHQVELAIKRAALSLGWKIKPVKPGHMVATLNLRKHMAKVSITYDTKQFNITYKDSAQLNYDGTSIHKNYNNWIINLEQNIKIQINTL